MTELVFRRAVRPKAPKFSRWHPVSFETRFWSKVLVRDDEACWEWLSSKQHGYGQIGLDGRPQLAHRWAYILTFGPIPDGLVIDHLCRNPGCCNPAHLEPVTHRENNLRGVSPAARNAHKTHCIRGHEFTPENTLPTRRGARLCRQCNRENCRAWSARRAS